MATSKKKRVPLPLGHSARLNFADRIPLGAIAHIANVTPPIKITTSQAAFLDSLQATVTMYQLDKQADAERASGIRDALWDIEVGKEGHPHQWAAEKWLESHGGKKLNTEKARAALREQVKQGRPREYAKYMLAISLAQLLLEQTTSVSVSTSRDNGDAATVDGILAQLFQNALVAVDGDSLADPFPYLQAAVRTLETQ